MSSSHRPLAVVVQLSAREPSDAALVHRVRSGVRNAEEQLYVRHAGQVLSLCLRLLGDRDEAEDVLQESFLDAFEELPELRDPSKFGRFVMGIVVGKAEALFRRRRARRFVMVRAQASQSSEQLSFLRPQAEVDLATRDQLAKLDGALGKLRDRDRACWMLSHVDGFTHDEVASLMHRPAAIVKRRIARAMRGLRAVVVPENLAGLLDSSRPPNTRDLVHGFHARRVLRGRPQTLWTRALRVGVGLALVLVLVLLGAGRRSYQEALPVTMRDQRNLPSTMQTSANYHAFDLSDGSRVTLSAGGRIDVRDNSQRELVLALRSGRARFDLLPRTSHQFQIEAGRVRAEVAAESHFVMERAADGVRVTVEQGLLVLRGDSLPGHVQRLTRGQTVTVR